MELKARRKNHNIGIMAHVDAGKTTLTERFLHVSGVTRKVGSVDKGTAATDSLPVERERGISVRLATESFIWNRCQINLIDTPGHTDFSAEIERSLRALDSAILVISAVEGVQAHTVAIFQALQYLKIPTIIFINKLDRLGADTETVYAEIQRELTPNCLLLQQPENQGQSNAGLGLRWQTIDFVKHVDDPFIESIVETIAEQDDELLERFLEGESLSFSELNAILARATQELRIIPILLGVAKQNIGIKELLNAVTSYFSEKKVVPDAPLSAVVFKIEHDKKLGKMAYVRVFSGSIQPRIIIKNTTRRVEEKTNQLKRVQKGRYIDIEEIKCGEIGVLSGLSLVQVGDVLGDDLYVPDAYHLAVPLLTVKVTPQSRSDQANLVQALTELSEEDPTLDLDWLPELRILHIKTTGTIQVEILQAVLNGRFSIPVDFAEPCIIYKETPLKSGYGYERYWMPKPCWAILKLKIEPGVSGSGVVYHSEVSVDDIAMKYQNEISATLDRALTQGIKGWQVTDIVITLLEGEDHPVHTRPGDFITATPMAIMNALNETDTQLLEPILHFRIRASRELLGVISSDVIKMRGSSENPEFEKEHFILQGNIPAATSTEYHARLASLSGGKAKLITRFHSYQACSLEQGKTSDYRGISPLDRDKWILKARGAIR